LELCVYLQQNKKGQITLFFEIFFSLFNVACFSAAPIAAACGGSSHAG
jgi:hypothetical protein